MNLGQLIDLLTAILGFIASIYFAMSALSLTPERILSLTSSESMIFFSDKQVESMADQKANNVTGAAILALTFLFQVIKQFVNTNQAVTCTWTIPVVIVMCLIFLLSYEFRKSYMKRTISQTKLIAGRNYFVDRIAGKLCQHNILSIISCCEYYMQNKRRDNEPLRDFLARYASYVGCSLPDDLDLSKVDHL